MPFDVFGSEDKTYYLDVCVCNCMSVSLTPPPPTGSTGCLLCQRDECLPLKPPYTAIGSIKLKNTYPLRGVEKITTQIRDQTQRSYPQLQKQLLMQIQKIKHLLKSENR